MDKQPFHYYGSTFYGWATADTREKVLKALARDVGSDMLKRLVKKTGGLSAVVCKVPLPQAAHYTIHCYLPHTITKEDGINEARKGERIQVTESENVRITTMTGRTIPNDFIG